jgi:hypothetical protein
MGIGRIGNAAHRKLSLRAEDVAPVAVGQLVQIELSGIMRLPGLRKNVAGLLATLKAYRNIGLLWHRPQLELGT